MTDKYRSQIAFLEDHLARYAEVVDIPTQYVRMKGFNGVIDVSILAAIVDCWAESIPQQPEGSPFPFDALVGLPSAGLAYASPLGLVLKDRNPHLQVLEGRKYSKPKGWKYFLQYFANSFTHGQENVPAFINVEDVPRGSKLAFVDDVIAGGHTMEKGMDEFEAQGYPVTHVFTIMDKASQEGVAYLKKRRPNLMISSLLTIEDVVKDPDTQKGKIILRARH